MENDVRQQNFHFSTEIIADTWGRRCSNSLVHQRTQKILKHI